MKKILYTDFISTGEIVEGLLENKEFKRAINRSNLYSFWKKIVTAKYKNKSRPWGMGGAGLMIIACENSIVAQELTMNKVQLLAKFQPYAKSLKIDVKDLKFDVKRWESENA